MRQIVRSNRRKTDTMKIRVTIIVHLFLFTLPFISNAQIWKYPPSPFLYSDEMYLNENHQQNIGIKSMKVKVYQGIDTLIAYTKYDKKGRIIEYKSELDADTAFYQYKKNNYWISVKFGAKGKQIKRHFKIKKDTISSIEKIYTNGKSLSKYYYDSNQHITKAIHNDSVIQFYTYSNNQLIGYSERTNGILKDSMNYHYSGDTVFYSSYLILQNEIYKSEEVYGIIHEGKLIQINSLEYYGGKNWITRRYFFNYNEQGKLVETGEEYPVNNEFERDYTEVFNYNENGLLKSRILIFKNHTSKPLCEYYYEMY